MKYNLSKFKYFQLKILNVEIFLVFKIKTVQCTKQKKHRNRFYSNNDLTCKTLANLSSSSTCLTCSTGSGERETPGLWGKLLRRDPLLYLRPI